MENNGNELYYELILSFPLKKKSDGVSKDHEAGRALCVGLFAVAFTWR